MDPHAVQPLTADDTVEAEPVAPETIAKGAVVALGSPLDPARLDDDLAFAADIGLTAVRLDVPWADAQPRPQGVNGGLFEALRATALTARSLGLAPWFRLLQPAVPHWFDDEGGFADDRAAATWWPRWVEEVADHLGDVAAGWVPFEAPFAMSVRMVPDDPRRHGELTHTLVVAWRDAWRILRGGPPVATSLDVATERPADETVQAAAMARRRDQLRWGLWLGGLADGVVRIPGRADRPLADLAGACDVIGLALRGEVETALYRAAEQGPPRPLAVTFRPAGTTDREQAGSTTTMWQHVRRAAGDLSVVAVTAATLLDAPGTTGIATDDRRLKDSGEAFVAG